MEKKQMNALGKVALGAGEIVSGLATFTGNGVVGKYLRERGLMVGAR